ncbi:hypothetical protein B9T29_11300 [Acinetobacter sp. ANC 3903]|nr:hypothetical protein B9T29_11300 [Acinetobacter sp. ANC 3903]
MRSFTQKATITLTIIAWLMQLSVFITPILQKHPELGFGVCEQLAIFTEPQPHSQHVKLEHAQHHMHEPLLQSESSSTKKNPLHSADSYCKFCLVLGQNFNPVFLACLLVLLALILCKVPRPLHFYSFKLHQKLYFFLFQNRAPPIPVVFTP